MPGSKFTFSCLLICSIEILTGILWVNFVKFPAALLDGISENCEVVFFLLKELYP